MQYRPLGNTDIQVSRICLGSMTWGEQNTEQQAHAQLDFVVSQGVNFVDTAELYPVAARTETQGLTETYIGRWLKKRQNRRNIVLATKAAGPGEIAAHIRGGPQYTHSHIEQAITGSLTRLQTDYIDLYYLHWPARNANFFRKRGYDPLADEVITPLQDSLQVLAAAVKAGKVRYIGISNETPWGLMTFLELAAQHGLPRIVSLQNPYNLLNRTLEIGLAEVLSREQVSLVGYSPLGFGTLSGKYLNSQPSNSRLALFDRFTRYSNPLGQAATARYVELAQTHNLSPAQMALGFVLSRPFLTSALIGATTLEQLAMNISSLDVVLSDEVLAGITEIYQAFPDPCP